jgi:formate hydrogenlyase subunit 3/multisubunit Na+/H+ antiporter MnhD subunit
LTSIPAIDALRGNGTDISIGFSAVLGEVPLRIDALSAWFILIINLTCINGALYGIGYLKPYHTQKSNLSVHWCLFLIFQVSMLWVCMLQHGLAFLIAWEIMSISSLMLIMFDHKRPETLKAGINYLVQMHIGAALLSIGFIWVYFASGSFDFNAIGNYFLNHDGNWIFLVFFIAFGIKAGFIPLHTWLPHAHPAAPSHISGVMSGVIVKLGIYGILRMITFLKTDLILIGEAMMILSVITAFYGILNAAVHRDFKKMLAFCTIENIGIIGIGIGLGLIGKGTGNPYIMFIGFAGALLHTLNHSLYKSLLFFTAGNIYQQTHTRNMEHLGGIIKYMPKTAFFYLVGAIAIVGLPPFNGFISEFLIYSGLITGIFSDNIQFSFLMIMCTFGLALAGGISMLTFTKSFGTIFLGTPRKQLSQKPREVVWIMMLPLAIIVILMLAIGVFPNLVFVPLKSVVNLFGSTVLFDASIIGLSKTMSAVGQVSLIMLFFIFMVYLIKRRVTLNKSAVFLPTWGCGYRSSSSKLFSLITTESKQYQEIEEEDIFPTKRPFDSHYIEFFEKKVIAPVNNKILGFLNLFAFIHNGKVQLYILYGFIFILALIGASFFQLI